MTEKKAYLGDGVYAEFSGYDISLTVDRGGRKEVVYLEPEVFDALVAFAKGHGFRVGAIKKLDPEGLHDWPKGEL